ncbi:hypothetical protein [Streptomyces sp. NPDC088775]|uniref:hypothetical protein n=1 Tax=Streptomyces sp. NPDC088775 TaxID=3365896 RepID=UPI0037FA5328
MIRMIRTTTLRALQEGAELASALEADLEAAERNAATDAGLRQRLATKVRDQRVRLVVAESRNTDLARLVELLLGAVDYAVDAAEAPLEVVLHQGRFLIAQSVTHAVFRAQVAEIARSIAFALLASDTDASVREVSGLLLKHCEVLGLDPHGPGDGAIDEKGTIA